jgi:hypothetical protein
VSLHEEEDDTSTLRFWVSPMARKVCIVVAATEKGILLSIMWVVDG